VKKSRFDGFFRFFLHFFAEKLRFLLDNGIFGAIVYGGTFWVHGFPSRDGGSAASPETGRFMKKNRFIVSSII